MNRDHGARICHRCPLIQKDPLTRTGRPAEKEDLLRKNPGKDDFAAHSYRIPSPTYSELSNSLARTALILAQPE